MDDLPYVIYAYFVLHNFCELNRESLGEECITANILYDREFQPQLDPTARVQDDRREEEFIMY